MPNQKGKIKIKCIFHYRTNKKGTGNDIIGEKSSLKFILSNIQKRKGKIINSMLPLFGFL